MEAGAWVAGAGVDASGESKDAVDASTVSGAVVVVAGKVHSPPTISNPSMHRH